LTLPESERTDYHIRTAQLITPEDNHSVHYHYVVARDFAKDALEMNEFILRQITTAFKEDVFALEALSQARADEQAAGIVEQSVASDQAGIAVRRLLKRMADSESACA
jgi:vanillate O-demethylase monooxygenase subunit